MSSRLVAEALTRNYFLTTTTESRTLTTKAGAMTYLADVYMIEIYRKADEGNSEAIPTLTFRTNNYDEAKGSFSELATFYGDSLIYTPVEENDCTAHCVGFCTCTD